jgi:hypothetical protein
LHEYTAPWISARDEFSKVWTCDLCRKRKVKK